MGLYYLCLKLWFSVYFTIFGILVVIKQFFTKHQTFDVSAYSSKGRVGIVTGGANGIGRATVIGLVKAGVHVIIGDVDDTQAHATISQITRQIPSAKVEYSPLNLTSKKSIRQFVDEFMTRCLPLHYLINNAGIMAAPYELTADGIESQLMTNHLGHFLLTNLLRDKLCESGTPECHARIVSVTSDVHKIVGGGREGVIDWENFNSGKYYSPGMTYAHTKLYQVQMTYKLQRYFNIHHKPVNAIAVHPGVVASNICQHQSALTKFTWDISQQLGFLKSVEQGADSVLCAALNPAFENRGIIYVDNCCEWKSLRPTSYMGFRQDEMWVMSCRRLGMELEEGMTEWIQTTDEVAKLFGRDSVVKVRP